VLTSNTRSTLCGSARSILPDMCSNANNSAACTATTATIAPLLSRGLRFDRYDTPGQRECQPRVAAAKSDRRRT
jgi:hypothetical protein